MTNDHAIRLAITALEREIARVQIDADLCDVWSQPRESDLGVCNFRTPHRIACSKHRHECRAAIEVLQRLKTSAQSIMELE